MHVYASELKKVSVALPCLEEQRIIARFLDHHTTKIETLVEKVQNLTERLREKRRALITEIVTRGLPSKRTETRLDACLRRPSGVAWLGDVPEHWMIKPLKRVVANIDRMAAVRGERNTHQFIGMNAVESWTGRLTDSSRLPLTPTASQSSRGFLRGDVLFGKLRPYLAKSCSPDFDGLCSGEFLVLDGNDDELSNRYLLYLLLSQYMVTMSDATACGTKMPRTNWREVGSVPVPVPPIREQEAISSFLDDATARIDGLVRHAETLIERLREKRQALITAAVTGQIDVRDEGRGETE